MALDLYKSRAAVIAKELKRTCSFNKFVICDMCGKRENSKEELVAHVRGCVSGRTCPDCNVLFKNRGNLFSHIAHVHSKKMRKKSKLEIPPALHPCNVCPKTYTQPYNLKYHIRREHYNMVAKIYEAEKRGINEVWFERVLNSEALVEMKKVTYNMFLMKKSSLNGLEISEPNETIDLSPMYPIQVRRFRIWCDICKETCYQQSFHNHVKEKHENLQRHHCNKCNKTFQKSNQYAQHKCPKTPRRTRKL